MVLVSDHYIMADENECQIQDIENNNNKKKETSKKESSRKTKIIRSSSNIENLIIISIFIYLLLASSFCLFLSFAHSFYPPPTPHPEPFKSLKHRQMVENYRLEDMSTSSCALGLVHTLAKTRPPTDRQNRQ